jgi:DNA segregation ATPase FtsK/SpoIIIE, S-DNA-T family
VAKKKTRTRQGSSFLSVVARAIGKVWSTLAGALGSSVRFLARGAKDLDPVHRRDGAGLLIIVLRLCRPAWNVV